jgi:hypothetical protein
MGDIGKKLVAEWNYIHNGGYDNFADWLKLFHMGYAKCYKGHWSKFDPQGRLPRCYGDK